MISLEILTNSALMHLMLVMFTAHSSTRGELRLSVEKDTGYVENMPMDYKSSVYDSHDYSNSTWPYKYHLRATTVSQLYEQVLYFTHILVLVYL